MGSRKIKRRSADRKQTSRALFINFDEPKRITSFQISPDGNVRLFQDGCAVVPSSTWLTTSYERPKGEKIIFRVPAGNDGATLHAFAARRRYKKLFIIDTNTVVLHGIKISISCFGIADTYDDTKTVFEFGGAFEFHNCVEKPENLAWSILHSMIVSSPEYDSEEPYAIVTDSDLGRHGVYNERSAPIFGDTYLACNIELVYASADVSRDVLNELIKLCDQGAKRFKAALKRGEVPEGIWTVRNGPCSHFRIIRPTTVLPRWFRDRGKFPWI